MAKAAFGRKKTLFASKLDLNLRKEPVKCCIWSIVLYGAETWALQKVDQKYLKSFHVWCWRRMKKISWTNRVRNEEVLRGIKDDRSILHTSKRRKKDNWMGHMLRKNCLLKRFIEGKIEGSGNGKTRKKT
jgi:hypothetical protein